MLVMFCVNLCSGGSMIHASGVIMTSCSFAVVWQVSGLVDVEAMKSWTEIQQLSSNPISLVQAMIYVEGLNCNLLNFWSIRSLSLSQGDLSNNLIWSCDAIKHAVGFEGWAEPEAGE